MMQRPSADTITVNFNQRTGYPPSWIYKEPESFFISKIISLFTFFTFNSYIALTLICSTIAGLCSWKLYELVKDFSFCKHWVLLARSEEHTSELQSRPHLVCRLLLEKKKNTINTISLTTS